VKAVSGAVAAAFAAGHVVLAQLVRIDFPTGTVALNSSTWKLTWSGVDYLGAAGLGSMAPVTDKPGELPGMQLEILRVDPTYIALALDGADQVQGSLVTLSTAVIDSSSYQILSVEQDWVGYADTMSIAEDGLKCSIGLTAESKGVDLLRGNPLVYNDGDQQSLVPGDRAFEYVADQADQPVVWPSRDFFYK
jgi:hypothetical protein